MSRNIKKSSFMSKEREFKSVKSTNRKTFQQMILNHTYERIKQIED